MAYWFKWKENNIIIQGYAENACEKWNFDGINSTNKSSYGCKITKSINKTYINIEIITIAIHLIYDTMLKNDIFFININSPNKAHNINPKKSYFIKYDISLYGQDY